jgi:hypothetical protein
VLDGVIDVLQWRADAREAQDAAESAYTSLLATRLGGALNNLQTDDPERAARILDGLARLQGHALRRVLLAPETSSRLLWEHPGRCDDRDLGRYLADVLEVEASTQTGLPDHPPASVAAGARWSALGDRCVDADGVSVTSQRELAGLTVDAESAAAVCFDGSTLHSGPLRLRHYTEPSARQLALEKVEQAMRGIDAFSSDVAHFVRRFTLVANIVVDEERAKFSSGSTGEYVGRSMFINAHLPAIDVERLADSLVHEAIHSLLYMHEVTEPWVRHEGSLAPDALVVSPWTGARLTLRNFLQACFVWFGLAHFWIRALHGSPFRRDRVEANATAARSGFVKGPLLGVIASCSEQVAPPLLDLIEAMQANILAAVRQAPDRAPAR